MLLADGNRDGSGELVSVVRWHLIIYPIQTAKVNISSSPFSKNRKDGWPECRGAEF